MSIHDMPALLPREECQPLGQCEFCGKDADNECCECGKAVCEEDSVIARNFSQDLGAVVRCDDCEDRRVMPEDRDRKLLMDSKQALALVRQIKWHITGSGWDERSEGLCPDLDDVLQDLDIGWSEPRRVA